MVLNYHIDIVGCVCCRDYVNLKYTDEFLINSARRFQLLADWRKTEKRHYGQALKRGLIGRIKEFLVVQTTGAKPTYSELELAEIAKRFKTRPEWEAFGKTEMADGKVSSYYCALAYGTAFFTKYCKRLEQRHRWLDEEILEVASHYKHKGDWSHSVSASHRAAYQAALKRQELFKRATAHMTPKVSPYSGDYTIYVYEFSDHHAYVGLTFLPESRHAQHMVNGPVHGHIKVCPEFSRKQLAEGLANPADAANAERFWIEHYRNEGWNMLNTASGGGLGAVEREWTKELVIAKARTYSTRKEWAVESQGTYVLAKREGWFEEAVAHMPRRAAVLEPRAPISEETRQKMRKAKLGKPQSEAQRRAKSESLRAYWARIDPEVSAQRSVKISEAVRGRPKTDAHKNALSAVMNGKTQNVEHRHNNAAARIGKKRGPYHTCASGLSPEEKRERRLETYRKSYQKRRPKILNRLKEYRDSRRSEVWQAALAANEISEDAPIPVRITHLSAMDSKQKRDHKRTRERLGYALRKAKAAGNKAEIERIEVAKSLLAGKTENTDTVADVVSKSSASSSSSKCHQRLIREQTLQDDLASIGNLLPANLKASDFTLSAEAFSAEHRNFIKRYEWLGNSGTGIKWCFTARLSSGILGGVVLMAEPYHRASDTALIARGACAGWTPKNLGSRLIMYGCRWIVANTDKRVFRAYADSEAGEVGQIYQACNFTFLGWKKAYYGVDAAGKRYSFQSLKRTSIMRRWLSEQGIELAPECYTENGYLKWALIPEDIRKSMRDYISVERAKLKKVALRRGAYVLVLGRNRGETRSLTKKLGFTPKPYPVRADSAVA